MRHSARLLLFACSWASSDSASLPLKIGVRHVQRLVSEADSNHWVNSVVRVAPFRDHSVTTADVRLTVGETFRN